MPSDQLQAVASRCFFRSAPLSCAHGQVELKEPKTPLDLTWFPQHDAMVSLSPLPQLSPSCYTIPRPLHPSPSPVPPSCSFSFLLSRSLGTRPAPIFPALQPSLSAELSYPIRVGWSPFCLARWGCLAYARVFTCPHVSCRSESGW